MTKDDFWGVSQNPPASKEWLNEHELRYYKTSSYIDEYQKIHVNRQEFLISVIIFGVIINIFSSALFLLIPEQYALLAGAIILAFAFVGILVSWGKISDIHNRYTPNPYDLVLSFSNYHLLKYVSEQRSVEIQDYLRNEGIKDFNKFSQGVSDRFHKNMNRVFFRNVTVRNIGVEQEDFFFNLVPSLKVNKISFDVSREYASDVQMNLVLVFVPEMIQHGQANGFKIYVRMQFLNPESPDAKNILDLMYEVELEKIPFQLSDSIYHTLSEEIPSLIPQRPSSRAR